MDLQAAEEACELAEADYLTGIRTDVDRTVLTDLASTVAEAAKAWNVAAYRAFHAASESDRQELDALTERTEVLSEMWIDVSDAYRG